LRHTGWAGPRVSFGSLAGNGLRLAEVILRSRLFQPCMARTVAAGIPVAAQLCSFHFSTCAIRSDQEVRQNLLGLCLAHLGYSYYWYLLVTWLPAYLVESRHFSIQQAGTSVLIPYLIYCISEPLGGWLANRLVRLGWRESHSRKGVITMAFLTSLALLLARRIVNDTAAVWLLGAASLVGLATGNILALLQRVAPEDEVGLWTGVLNSLGIFPVLPLRSLPGYVSRSGKGGDGCSQAIQDARS